KAAEQEWRRRIRSGTRLAERPVIGVRGDRDRFDEAALRAFHTRWYRPDNMSLVVIGDVFPAEVRGQVRRVFGALGRPAGPMPERPALGTPDLRERDFAIVEPECTKVRYEVQCTR